MSIWSGKPYVALRVLGLDGHYPGFQLRSKAHLYVSAERLVWAAVLQPPLPEDWEWPESPILVPEEVRLLAAIALSEPNPWDNGLPIITHGSFPVHVDADRVGDDLQEPEAFRFLEQTARSVGVGPNHRLPSGPDESKPVGYRVSHATGRLEDAVELLHEIDASDQLLLAGLARFLEATRLLNVCETEAAATSLFTSMSAALEFIRLYFQEQAGGGDVPFPEVLSYFRRTFDHGDDVAQYFEDRWAERLTIIHPANRYGEFWAPPLMVGDIYHLRRSIIALYRHIILGEIAT